MHGKIERRIPVICRICLFCVKEVIVDLAIFADQDFLICIFSFVLYHAYQLHRYQSRYACDVRKV